MTPWRQWNSHLQRVVTGLLLAVPLLAVLAFGPSWSVVLLVAMAAGVGLWEFQGLLFPEGLSTPWMALYIALGLILPMAAALGGHAGLHMALAGTLFAGFLVPLAVSPGEKATLLRLSRFSLGWLYVPYLLSYALLIQNQEAGRSWLFFILLVVTSCDAGAYYSGRRWGKMKLYERVSPKKTVEGSVGGLAVSMALGTLFGILFMSHVPVWWFPPLSAGLAVVSQVGDLMESMIKRMSGKKDSSSLLPGHGGVLDRLDSLLFSFPATWFFLQALESGVN